MRIFIVGNSGVENRGCEAIIRSTVEMFKCRRSDVFLSVPPNSFRDLVVASELGINSLPLNEITSKILRYYLRFLEIFLRIFSLRYKIIYQPIISNIRKDDLCLFIGGDTYCYSTHPFDFYYLNKYVKKKGAKSILWCCTIDNQQFSRRKQHDLKKFDFIFARENDTYDLLLKYGFNSNNVKLVCDPAFLLRKKEFNCGYDLSNHYIIINLSECVIIDSKLLNYFSKFISYVLETTEYKVVLLPHVYSIAKKNCDYDVLLKLVKINGKQSNRIILINEELDCEELKGIISKASFTVCARTHVSIASYSCIVPTLVIGYSSKSVGIAKDLFGTSEKFVLDFRNIKSEIDIIQNFNFIREQSTNIKKILSEKIPIYSRKILNEVDKIEISDDILCERKLCTECGNCKLKCLKNAISDDFIVDSSKCVTCQLCSSYCHRISTNNLILNEPRNFYLCKAKDKSILNKSSSGGAVYVLCANHIKQGGVVYGVAFNHELVPCYVKISNIKDLEKIQGSKYVSVDFSIVSNDIINDLKSETKVLFIGSPCNVASLKMIVPKELIDNLILVDFICHGTPDLSFWKMYLKYLEDKYKSKVVDYYFRNKENGWENSGCTKVVFESGKTIIISNKSDLYYFSFSNNFILKKSCYFCSYRALKRVSDLSVGDAWGYEMSNSQNDGLSFLTLNTNKGAKLFKESKEEVFYKEINKDQKVLSKFYGFVKPTKFYSEKLRKSRKIFKIINRKRKTNKNKLLSSLSNLFKWPWKDYE